MKRRNDICVLGAGSWGTALACMLGGKGLKTSLWGHDHNHIEILRSTRTNERYLAGVQLPETVSPTGDMAEAVRGCPVVCMVVPSQFYREVYRELLEYINDPVSVISAAKGIENTSLQTMTQLMEEENTLSPGGVNPQRAVLSGPSFAKEVARNIPTAVTIGADTSAKAEALQRTFASPYFRVYASTDVLGLEISAAFKNVIAIAAGICDGIGYGHNTRAALITRGLAEITRLGMHLGCQSATFSGLSGMGDLILTCTGDLSRNRTVGLKLGRGEKLKKILSEMNMVAEGVKTTLSGYRLAQREHIEMPILEQVYRILYEDKDCTTAVDDLLSRGMKPE